MADQANPVRLSVPAEPSFARAVRMLAANLAVVAGLSLDEVEDVRMVAEEGFVWACATGPASCEVAFEVAQGSLAMEFCLGPGELLEDDQATTYAALILETMCDEFVCDAEAGVLRLRKGSGALDA